MTDLVFGGTETRSSSDRQGLLFDVPPVQSDEERDGLVAFKKYENNPENGELFADGFRWALWDILQEAFFLRDFPAEATKMLRDVVMFTDPFNPGAGPQPLRMDSPGASDWWGLGYVKALKKIAGGCIPPTLPLSPPGYTEKMQYWELQSELPSMADPMVDKPSKPEILHPAPGTPQK